MASVFWVQAVGMWITDKFKHQIQISVLDFKMKHRMQYWDPLTGQSYSYGT